MNSQRGEAEVEIAGTRYRLCLTLGGLAALETAFGCASLSELTVRLKHLSAAEMQSVLSVLIAEDFTQGELARVSPGEAARAIGEAFRAALG